MRRWVEITQRRLRIEDMEKEQRAQGQRVRPGARTGEQEEAQHAQTLLVVRPGVCAGSPAGLGGACQKARAQSPGGYDCDVTLQPSGAFDAPGEPDATETPIVTATATLTPVVIATDTPTAQPTVTATVTRTPRRPLRKPPSQRR